MTNIWVLVSGAAGFLLGWYAHYKGGHYQAITTLAAFLTGGLLTWTAIVLCKGMARLIRPRKPQPRVRIDPW